MMLLPAAEADPYHPGGKLQETMASCPVLSASLPKVIFTLKQKFLKKHS
jgi:hypothetical protein